MPIFFARFFSSSFLNCNLPWISPPKHFNADAAKTPSGADAHGMIKEESKGQTLNGSKDVYNILKPIFAENDDVERMYCIFLDTKNHILAIETVSTGSISSSAIYPREIVKRVIKLKLQNFLSIQSTTKNLFIHSPKMMLATS